MAATWQYNLVFTNLSSKVLNVTAIRTDGEDVRNFSLPGILADTHEKSLTQIRDEISAKMYAQYEAEVAKEVKIVALLNGWAAGLKIATEALEQ